VSISAATTAAAGATHSHSLAWLVTAAVLVLLAVTAGYLTTCWLFPFTTCHHTHRGTRGAIRRAWVCHRCENTGRRVRAGRRLINHVRTARGRR
jgi:hypothetical protein